MKRREFLRVAGGSGAVVSLGAGVAAGQEGTDTATGSPPETPGGTAQVGNGPGNATGTGDGTGTGSGGGGGGGGGTEEVVVGPGGSLVFEPETLEILPGTTVNFVWESDNHNVIPDSQPDGANWEGTPGGESETYDTGYEYSHTFETLGSYEYYCSPHLSAGMEASIEVVEELSSSGGRKELHSLGVPIQAHWVGAATILMIFMSLVFTFYVLKYGESPNTGNMGGRE